MILVCIIVAGLCVGIQTYPSMEGTTGRRSDSTQPPRPPPSTLTLTFTLHPPASTLTSDNEFLKGLDVFILIIFALECAVKTAAEGSMPSRYCTLRLELA